MNVRWPDIFYFLVGFQWVRANLNLRVYAECCPIKHAWMDDVSFNPGKFKDVLVGG
jgi:hypothetical protein